MSVLPIVANRQVHHKCTATMSEKLFQVLLSSEINRRLLGGDTALNANAKDAARTRQLYHIFLREYLSSSDMKRLLFGSLMALWPIQIERQQCLFLTAATSHYSSLFAARAGTATSHNCWCLNSSEFHWAIESGNSSRVVCVGPVDIVADLKNK